MTAHNPATLAYAERRAEFALDRLSDLPREGAYLWANRLRTALSAPRQGSIRAWLEAHDGTPIETLQLTVRLYGAEPSAVEDIWIPGARTVSVRSTYAWLGDYSRRYYRGVVTLASDDDIWLGFAPWGDDAVQLVCYASRDRVRAEQIMRDITADESLGSWEQRMIAAATAGARA